LNGAKRLPREEIAVGWIVITKSEQRKSVGSLLLRQHSCGFVKARAQG
jgi:hypothetical protein